MMKENIDKAFSEVLDIINHFPKDLYNKVPKDFIEILETNRDTNYNVNIDYSKSINDQKLLDSTRVVLSLIYRDYICSKEERERLLEQDDKEIEEYKNLLQGEYEIDFDKRNSQIKNYAEDQNVNEQIQDVAIVQEKWYIRIFNKILNIFKLSK